jgi:hypothetical protein
MANRLDVEQIGTGRDFVLLHSLLSDRSASSASHRGSRASVA